MNCDGSRLSRAVFPVLVVTLTMTASTASRAASQATPAALYSCTSANPTGAVPPPAPQLSPAMAASVAAAAESDHFTQVCPSGEVPYPAVTSGSPKLLRSEEAAARRAGKGRGKRPRHGAPLARAARENGGNGYWYSHSLGEQQFAGGANVAGEFVEQSNEQPFIDYRKTGKTGAHSLAQLWASADYAPGKYSDVEEGWSESWGQFGDVNPHLFIYAVDANVSLGYVGSGIPWVQNSTVAYPNMTLTHNDTWHTYGAELNSYGWWFYYDGQWVGYIPKSAWTRFYPPWLNDIEAGGEVATPEEATCTDMGDEGEYGTEPYAAMFKEVWYLANGSSIPALLKPFNSDPTRYSVGNWYGGQPGPEFRYGGPGWCAP